MNEMVGKTHVSVIVPIHNGEKWINKCFESIESQTVLNTLKLEISVCDDSSNDETQKLLQIWNKKFQTSDSITLKIFRNENPEPGGVGYAKNRAVDKSTGEYLCFQDVDDIMLPCRIEAQYKIAKANKNAIIGGRFKRIPENATARFSSWANGISGNKLHEQIYTSHGPTVIMPTWFCHRTVFDRVGGFSEAGRGCPEDLIFFYSHLDHGGQVIKIDLPILIYVYHPEATTFSICEKTIWDLRLARLQTRVLPSWDKFTIWNAGKQGRLLFRSLENQFKDRVVAFCDVDRHKIGQNYISYEPVKKKVGRPIPVIHFTEAKPPFVICVKLVSLKNSKPHQLEYQRRQTFIPAIFQDMTNGEFEDNLASLNLKEGTDFVHFN